ncbi:hypothetical protein PBAL39_23597 [Pedobacter sp. BAL39]|uniref:hypothetical protein n=1 Tax=Pedobacter sp. BAL39 TaxID=391596 RepID=UPI000155931E|nr:hypothetical protein [Pedobacter sp. BAL39]EDM36045.1 hypothetical protein PBAL39_23597 [Pedobacter sp. BAL39]
MKADKNNTLEIAENFEEACGIYKVKPASMLQLFINHISFYQSLSNEFNGCYSLATNALLSHALKDQRGPSTPFMQQRAQSIKYLAALITLVAASQPSENEKRTQSREIISKIHESVHPHATFADHIMIDETQALRLSPDFCVLCELHNYHPKEVLENFMKDISLADDPRGKRLKLEEQNIAADFFFSIVIDRETYRQ